MRTFILISLLAISAQAFTPTPTQTSSSASTRRTIVMSSTAVQEASDAASTSSSSGDNNKNKPNWEVKQHRYGLDMMNENNDSSMSVTLGADGEEVTGDALPLPQTYITCGKCKSLFAIAEEDLGDKGKGW